MSARILAIDDERNYGDVSVLARTYSDGLKLLQDFGPWNMLYLDHDLGCVLREFDTNGTEMTGYKIATYLEENQHLAPEKIYVVTSNGPGLKNIGAALDQFMDKKGVRTWVRRS